MFDFFFCAKLTTENSKVSHVPIKDLHVFGKIMVDRPAHEFFHGEPSQPSTKHAQTAQIVVQLGDI